MTAWRRRIGTVLAIAALAAAIAGCASDARSPTAEQPGTGKLRYYGGPKSPMWPGQ